MRVYEIHRYMGDQFQYVVARTNKHSEEYVKADVDKMNALLTPEVKATGVRYVFALGTVDGMAKKTGENTRKKKVAAEKSAAGTGDGALLPALTGG
jgi:hypothetical protein